jgi:hypothetical protein
MEYPPTVTLFEQELNGVRDQLRASLLRARSLLHHAGNKGSYIEDAFRNSLRQYLPRSLGVGHGEVIDLQNRRSSQLDLIVATPDHPNWYRDGAEPSLFLIEGVAAVGEIKAVLTSQNLTDVLVKAVNFRALSPDRSSHCEVLANEEDAGRFYRSPPYFVFALEAQMNMKDLATVVTQFPTGDRSAESVDAVFVLDRGFVLNFGNGKSAFTSIGHDTDEPLTGYYYEDKDPLLMLVRWLPLMLAVPISQLPILPRYILANASGAIPPDATPAIR